MGSSKKQTVGYWYKLLLHYGICRGPIDAFLEFRGGDRTAWAGELTSSGTININAPNLWGGEKSEGGIVGSADVMFGEPDQAPSGYLAANLTPQQPGLRGKFSFLFKGGRFGINPYPKSIAFKLRRILAGWDDDAPWYPEKAEIPLSTTSIQTRTITDFTTGFETNDAGAFTLIDGHIANTTADPHVDNTSYWRMPIDQGFITTGMYCEFLIHSMGQGDPLACALQVSDLALTQHTTSVMPMTELASDPLGRPSVNYFSTGGGGQRIYPAALDVGVWYSFETVLDYAAGTQTYILKREGVQISTATEPMVPTAPTHLAFQRSHNIPGQGVTVASYRKVVLTGISGTGAMNPAHIIFDSLTQQDMQGEPLDNVDLASFEAAADRLYSEGFGLCTEYDHQRESTEQFQERIQNIAGLALSQSRIDGRYRLDVIRGDYDLETLPILSDADILEFSREQSNPNDSVNEVIVEWFDPHKKEKRATTPMQSLGAIRAAGAVISETAKYPEIPSESLALRVAARDLKNKSSPTNRFNMTTTRKPYGWRSGTFFRLQAPRRGIADMVCMVGEISAGTLRSGSMTMTAIQDVSGMPDTTYVEIEPGVDTQPSQTPEIPAAQHAFEAPYVELAGTLPNAELAALPVDAGYLLAMAARPGNGINFSLWTKADGEEYADQGVADWCPTALVVEAATIDSSQTAFTLSGGKDLDRVTVGTAALWGSEAVRVDAIDPDTGAVTFGRAVCDTVIAEHAAGERVWFYDAWGATDQREYAAGEEVSAKMLTRTSSQELAIDLAPASVVEMDQRAQRPYPPAGLRINGELLPSTVIGDVVLTWEHRDRLLQADQLVDDTEPSIGPEPGTTYTARYLLNGALVETQAGIVGTTTSYTPVGGGLLRIELESVRDGLTSWQMHVREITIGSPLLTEDDQLISTEDDEPILME